MQGNIRAITCLGGTGKALEHAVEESLRDIPSEQIISVSYAVSRLLGITLQHHALIVLKRPE